MLGTPQAASAGAAETSRAAPPQAPIGSVWHINMADVYVEPRPKGRPNGTPIEDYAVEDRANAVLYVTESQQKALDWAWANGHSPFVARVRHTDKGNVLHWKPARSAQRDKASSHAVIRRRSGA